MHGSAIEHICYWFISATTVSVREEKQHLDGAGMEPGTPGLASRHSFY